MSTTTPVDDVEAFIAAVKERLAGVPDEERAELLDDVAAHVREVADEFGSDQLTERLGTPEQFSEELRASAGYAPTDEALAPPTAKPGAVRRLWAKTTGRLGTDANRELWRKLEPGWFVVRGALFGAFIFSATGANGGVLLLAVAIACAVASFKLGERRPATQTKWVRWARITGEVGLVLFGLTLLNNGSSTRTVYYDSSVGYERDPCLRDSAGRAISNLYAFDAAGQMIPQFFLTDEKGRPIDSLCPGEQSGGQVQTTYVRDVNGAPVYNVFPREQKTPIIDPQSGTVTGSKPVPPPAVVLPNITPTTQPEATPSP